MASGTCLILLGANTGAKELPSVFELSMKELISIDVSVASSESEAILETPAIVSRYNRHDLEKMGVSNLREMFNFIPGVIVQDSLPGWASVQIRGIDETFNQKVLFLLDGVPYHQPSHSIIPMEGIPWESISHVEVIRGPGAVFHGTQASGGVFNVVTRRDLDKRSVSLKVGKNKLKAGSVYYNKQFTEKSALYLAAEFRAEDGYNASYTELFPDVGLISDKVNRVLENESVLIRYTNNEASIQIHAFSDTTTGINDAYADLNTLQPFINDTKGYLIHLENSWTSENSRTQVFADYNHYTFDLQIHNLFAPGTHALINKEKDGKNDYRIRLGANTTYRLGDSIDLEAGIEHETRSVGAYQLQFLESPGNPLATLFEKGSTDELSAYSQLEYSYQDFKFYIGARYTDNEKNGSKITPRLAGVYNIDAHQSLKLLYSTGFNSPNPTQTDLYLPGNVVGNKTLDAEIVKASDVAYTYSKTNFLFVANVYHLEAEDFIVRQYSEELNSVTFFNDGNYTRQGAELDLQIARERSKLFVNVAYQKEGNKIDPDDADAYRIPRLTTSVGASVDLNDTHSLGASLSYISSRHGLNDFTVVNVNYTARFSDIDVFLLARNLFDEDILNPNNTSQNSTLVAPGEEGVHIQLGFRFHF